MVPEEAVLAVRGDPSINLHNLSARPDMQVGGVLRYDATGRCLTVVVAQDDREEIYTPVWPLGTRGVKQGTMLGVEVPDFGRIRAGEEIQAAGDMWSVSRSRATGAKSCGAHQRLMVLNPNSFRTGAR